MELDEIQKFFEEAKSRLYFFIKNEVKRKIIGETYPYLVKIPDVAFWMAAIVTTFAMLAIELVLAGIFYSQNAVVYGELLLGFGIAVGMGLVFGFIYSRRVSKMVHSQISDVLKHKTYTPEEELEDVDKTEI